MKFLLRLLVGTHVEGKKTFTKGAVFETLVPWHKKLPQKFALAAERPETFDEEEVKKEAAKTVTRKLSERYTAIKEPGKTRWKILDETSGDFISNKTFTLVSAKKHVKKLK